MQKSNGELVPGGLAMVVGFKNDPSNVGRIVVTESRAYAGHEVDGFIFRGNGGAWFCTADGLFVVRGDKPVSTGYAYISAKNLMPINPEADPLHVSEREKCQA